jgi:hypothetical protein
LTRNNELNQGHLVRITYSTKDIYEKKLAH